jgi:hypothetical protein
MFTRLVPAFLLVGLVGWAVFAQQPEPKVDSKAEPKVPAKTDGPTVELRLSDDTQLKVVWLDQSLAVSTRYGKLTIPTAEIRRLEFGFRYPDGLEAKIDKAIGELGANEFRDREAAEQFLADSGHYALPNLRRALRSENPEVVRRANSIIKLVEGKLGSEKTEMRDYDTIETLEFTLKGRIENSVLKVRTKFFGEATIKLADIRTFRALGAAALGEFALDAALYAKQNQTNWLETSVEVASGQQLEITASGQIDTWPQAPGQYMVGPAGVVGALGGQPQGFGGVARVGFPGQVIARVGANGTPFVVGASFKGKVTESGRLYLRIAPSQWGNDSSGNYKIKVTTE